MGDRVIFKQPKVTQMNSDLTFITGSNVTIADEWKIYADKITSAFIASEGGRMSGVVTHGRYVGTNAHLLVKLDSPVKSEFVAVTIDINDSFSDVIWFARSVTQEKCLEFCEKLFGKFEPAVERGTEKYVVNDVELQVDSVLVTRTYTGTEIRILVSGEKLIFATIDFNSRTNISNAKVLVTFNRTECEELFGDLTVSTNFEHVTSIFNFLRENITKR